MTKNEKAEYLQTVEAAAAFAGSIVGALVVAGKEIQDCVRNLMAAKPGPEPKAKPEPSAEPQKQVRKKNQAASGKKSSPK